MAMGAHHQQVVVTGMGQQQDLFHRMALLHDNVINR
jgi:hypothetical protein